jgi:hypothetical protein
MIYADRGEDDPFVAVELVHTYVTANHQVDVEMYRDIYRRLSSPLSPVLMPWP